MVEQWRTIEQVAQIASFWSKEELNKQKTFQVRLPSLYTGRFLVIRGNEHRKIPFDTNWDWTTYQQGPVNNRMFREVAAPELTVIGKLVYGPFTSTFRFTANLGAFFLPRTAFEQEFWNEFYEVRRKIYQINRRSTRGEVTIVDFTT